MSSRFTVTLLVLGALAACAPNPPPAEEIGDTVLAGDPPKSGEPPKSVGASAVSVGALSACAVLGTGAAKCWGLGQFGQTGRGKKLASIEPPSAVVGLSGARQIGVRRFHACARTRDGRVSCWGDNGGGWLGDGTTQDHLNPQPVRLADGTLLANVIDLSVGTTHSCAVDAAGDAYCWGFNTHGELGDGTTTDRRWAVKAGSGFTQIAAGELHTCALRANGDVWCWGANTSRQLGDGTSNARFVPGPSVISGAIAVASGASHSCAVRSDGAVRCWGSNGSGQAGTSCDGAGVCAVAVERSGALVDLTGARSLSLGLDHGCALGSAGEVHCWGANASLQLGGATAREITATAVRIEGVVATAIATGDATTCVVTANGTVECWGKNFGGEAGDVAATPRTAALRSVLAL
jgi:alpha-tubulin suppressor-like RCC1 family protein